MKNRSRSLIDRLIAESKQVTSDLMALRHEIERSGLKKRSFFGGAAERARLICDNVQQLADDVHKVWEAGTDFGDEDDTSAEIDKPRPRALGNGQFRLTAGGR